KVRIILGIICIDLTCSNLSIYLLLLIIKNHPVTQEITLSLPVENTEKSPKDHNLTQSILLQRL
ncbi:MAG: hypothetical protein Q8M44_05240, partial [bacterium]|nr:hypothetical protein [bacterium]